jgi:hypothetical protein
MGGATIVPRGLRTKRNKKFFKIGQFLYFLKSFVTLLYLLIMYRFSKIRSINSDMDSFICQSWAKMSKLIPLSIRLSGIEFILV